MKLAVFFVSISSFCVVCGLCRGDLTVSTPLNPPPPVPRLLLTPDSPPRECTAAKTGRAGWHVGRKRKRGERHLRWMINAKKQDLQSGTADGVFASVSSQRENSHIHVQSQQTTGTFLHHFFIQLVNFFPFFLFLIRDAVLKKAKTSSYELLLCTALSQQLLSFSTRDKPCNQKLLWSHFDFSVSGFLLTCHV